MPSMFAVDDNPPHNPSREAVLTKQVSRLGGRLSFREEPEVHERGAVCLTDEFAEIVLAEQAADALRWQGEHVEGPVDYACKQGAFPAWNGRFHTMLYGYPPPSTA